jgi:hypothetical protein
VQLYTVPGQVFYDATRKLVLRGADGVVFVADSQPSMRESNLQSLENLKTNLRINRLDPDKVALVFQYNKRDLPNAASIEEMSSYLKPGNAPVVEAAALTGVGVTATLRAAVSRILDNLKNNVDTTLYEEPELAAPDMSQRSGVAPHSAGTPKLSMKSTTSGTVPVPEPEAPQAAPFFDTGEVAVQAEEDDPFAHVATAAPPEFDEAAVDDLFATATPAEEPVHDERAELEALLANARGLVASLEAALERARENERAIASRLAR